MKTHQNTILAMKISTLLMSVSATVLVIMLLTSNAVAKQNSDAAANNQEVVSEVAPVDTAPLVDTAPPPVQSRTKLVIMRIVAVTATPDTSAATNAMQLARQGRSAIPVGGQRVEGETQDIKEVASAGDLPQAPVLSAVDAPVAPAAAPVVAANVAAANVAAARAPAAAAPAQNNNNQSSAPKQAPAPAAQPAPAPAPAPKPAPAPAPAPAPKPQPPVKTETS